MELKPDQKKGRWRERHEHTDRKEDASRYIYRQITK